MNRCAPLGELFHLLFNADSGEPARDEQGDLVYLAVAPPPGAQPV